MIISAYFDSDQEDGGRIHATIYEEGYITLEELAKCLKDEAGVEVDCW